MSAIVVTTLWMYGLAIVVSLGVAVVIKLIVVVLGALERRPAEAPAAAAPRPAVASADDAVPAEHVAAIAAAIHALIGEHRIVHILDGHKHDGWVAEGRVAHHRSHSLDHHPRR